jgi:hypothetical protein
VIAAGLNILGGKILLVPIEVLGCLAVVLIFGTAVLRRRQVHTDAASAGLFGVTGRMGGGKSYFLTYVAAKAISKGRPVFSTFEISGAHLIPTAVEGAPVVPWDGVPLSVDELLASGFKGWQFIIRVPAGALVIVDEAHGWWPSQAWNAPVDVRMWISTLRHRGISVFWGTQWVNAVARWLRELSFGIWECEHFKKGHRYTLYDPRLIAGKVGTRPYLSRVILIRKPEIMAMYDTHNIVSSNVEWSGVDG